MDSSRRVTSRPDSLRHNRGGLLICLLLAALLGLLLARAWSIRNHTLEASGMWSSSKSEIERSLLGARSFFSGTQALAEGRLDLGAWHGFHQVMLRQPVDPVTVELEFQLTQGSYLVVLFNELPGQQTAGLRLAWNRRFPSLFLTASDDGEFLGKTGTGLPLLRHEGWHYLRLTFLAGEVEAVVDARPPIRFALPLRPLQRIGFRAGAKPVRVDNVVIRARDGHRIRETFERPAAAPRIAVVAAAGAVSLSAVLIGLLATGRGSLRRRLFGLITAELVLVIGTALLLPVLSHRARAYPGRSSELAAREETLRQAELDRVVAEITERHPTRPQPGKRRLLFLGASQTWGAGARTADEVWVRRLEGLLDRQGGGLRFECINAGASSARSSHLARVYDSDLVALQPWAVVVNIATNDPRAETLEQNLERIVATSRRAGVRVFLLLEPNSTEMWNQPLLRKHDAVRAVGKRHQIPVIDLHSALAELYDSGFLWWDIVHLSSYGQRLFAEILQRELLRLGVAAADPDAVPTLP